MTEIIKNIGESLNWLEKMKVELNPFLEWYLEERLNKKWENEKKEAFLAVFNNYSLEEKRAYRDYLYQIIKNPIKLEDLNDDLSQIKSLIENLKSMDKLEIYAWICNNCKVWNNLQENKNPESGVFETPNFIIKSWSFLIDWKKFQIWTLWKDYMWNWQYQLFINEFLDQKTIDELWLRKWVVWELPKSLIIWKDKVFAQDSLWTYEIKTLKISNKKIVINIPWYWINITLDKMDI